MLDDLRRWLARWLLPDEPPSLPPRGAPEPPEPPPRPRSPPDAEAPERAARKLAEAEKRARQAEERARKAERARSELDEAVRAAEARAATALERARQAELAVKRETHAQERAGKRRRGKGEALEAKLQAAGEELRAARQRMRDAELRLDDADAARRALENEKAALENENATLDARIKELEARPAAIDTVSDPGRRRPAAALAEAAFSPGDECLTAIRSQFSKARTSVDVCVFTITDDRVAEAIAAAHRRGVTIRVITDNDKAFDPGSDVRKLEAAGIEVREDRTAFHMHHKFAIFDGRVLLTGSYNWTRGAARDNEENLIVTDDSRLVGPFAREFSALWSRLQPQGP